MDSTQRFHEEVAQGRRILSYSQILDWMTCRQRWFYRYGCGVQPKRSPRPMTLGDLVHKCLAGFLSGEEQDYNKIIGAYQSDLWSLSIELEDSSDEEMERIEKLADDARSIVERTLRTIEALAWHTHVLPDGSPAVELELKTEVPGFNHFASHLDWCAYDTVNDLLWLVDFKVRKSFSPLGYEDVNLQHLIYAYMANLHKIPIIGTVTFEISSDPPKQPKRNKDGSMSRSAVHTDWETYRAALIESNLAVSLYDDMREKLEGVRFTQILQEYRSDVVMSRTWSDIVLPAAREIRLAYHAIDNGQWPVNVYRQMRHMACNGCGVRDICLTTFRGYDATPQLTSQFEYREEMIERILNS